MQRRKEGREEGEGDGKGTEACFGQGGIEVGKWEAPLLLLRSISYKTIFVAVL